MEGEAQGLSFNRLLKKKNSVSEPGFENFGF